MRKRNVLRRYLILLVVIVFPLAGYLTVGSVKTCKAQVCMCGGLPCIAIGSGLANAINQIYSNIVQPGIQQVQGELIAYTGPLQNIFSQGIAPVPDWMMHQMEALYDTLWYYVILPSMEDMTRQLNLANVTQAEELGAFEDAKNINKTNAAIADMQIKDHRELRPNAPMCMAGTMMSTMLRTTSFSEGYSTAASVGKIWRSANTFGFSAAGGRALDMSYTWQHKDSIAGTQAGYVPFWCDPTYNNGNAGCTANGTDMNNDIDIAGMIFGGTGYDTIPLTTGAPLSPPPSCVTQCLSFSGSTCIKIAIDAADSPSCASKTAIDLNRLTFNLAEPFVKDPVTANPYKGGKAAILKSVSYKARRQVVYDGLDYVISRRVPAGLSLLDEQKTNLNTNNALGSDSPKLPTASSTPPLALAPGEPEFQPLLQEIRALTGEAVSTSTNPSRDEVLRALMTQRFRSGAYSISQITDPENNQREMVVDQALQDIQLSDDLDIMDHQMLLLAAQVSSEIQHSYHFTNASEGAPTK